MTPKKRNIVRDLRATTALVIEAVHGVAGVVESMQLAQVEGLGALGRPLKPIYDGISGFCFGTLRGVTRLVGGTIDRGLSPLERLAGEQAPRPWLDATLAVLNGVLGDYLEGTRSPLAIQMELRYRGARLTLKRAALAEAMPEVTDKLLVLVHGSCASDGQWTQSGQGHGEALARELGYTPVYVRYNSGLHISTNGEVLAELLEQLVGAWPVPLEDFVILGHSMGGLVARAACRSGEQVSHRWRTQLRTLIFLGTPHLGAPYERLGNLVDIALGFSPYSAPLAKLGKMRSAGVTDLRFGYVCREDWLDHDRFDRGLPARFVDLPEGVACYAIAASLSETLHGKLRDDGLVPVDSALGKGQTPGLALQFPPDHTTIIAKTGHLTLLSSLEVYETLRGMLTREHTDFSPVDRAVLT